MEINSGELINYKQLELRGILRLLIVHTNAILFVTKKSHKAHFSVTEGL